MKTSRFYHAESSRSYPFFVKNLLISSIVNNPNQARVYRRAVCYTCRALGEQIPRLTSALTQLGEAYEKTVAVKDRGINRYLERLLAVPLIGAVLHTIQVCLSPGQILCTINNAEDDVLLVNGEFLPLQRTDQGPHRCRHEVRAHLERYYYHFNESRCCRQLRSLARRRTCKIAVQAPLIKGSYCIEKLWEGKVLHISNKKIPGMDSIAFRWSGWHESTLLGH